MRKREDEMEYPILSSSLKSQTGATAIIVGLLLFLFIGVAALVVDVAHLYFVKNELQNAADAGALAAASVLYLENGAVINEGCNEIGRQAAVANAADGAAVEVSAGDVERGHWSFATRRFSPNTSTTPFDLWNVSEEELDTNPDFINAVRVVARRESSPVTLFFARLFGDESLGLNAEAVAYIGFAGTLYPEDVDQPIAICAETIRDEMGRYTCNMGRWINSGGNVASHETAGWCSFNQDDPCTGGTNANEVKSLVISGCPDGGANQGSIIFGKDIATNGGMISSAFAKLYDCWKTKCAHETVMVDGREREYPTRPWELTLPVITCPGNNVGTCEEVRGAVTVNILLIVDNGFVNGANAYDEVPYHMAAIPPGYGAWENSSPDGSVRWQSFVEHYHLQNVDGSSAPYDSASMYFLPDCEPHEPRGRSGGENFGILAKTPVLVK